MYSTSIDVFPSTSCHALTKSAHRITNAHMLNKSLLLLLYMTHLGLRACQCCQLHARAKNSIQQSQLQPTKCMPITKLWTPSQQEVGVIHQSMYHTLYNVSYIDHTQGSYLIKCNLSTLTASRSYVQGKWLAY